MYPLILMKEDRYCQNKMKHSMNCVSCDIFCNVIFVDKNIPTCVIAAERKYFISKFLPNAGTSSLGDTLIPCPLFELSYLLSSIKRGREPVLKIKGEQISSYHKPEATVVDWWRGTVTVPWQVWICTSLTYSCYPRLTPPHSGRQRAASGYSITLF